MATTQENKIIFSIEFTEKGAIRKIDGVTTSVKKFDAELKKATLANKQFNQTLSGREGMTTNAGLAGATLTELGRTISDMPYGIRGIANNLSQLSTLFITLQGKVDSNVKGFGRLTRTLQMLKRELFGPLGIILAFQVFIALLDAMAQGKIKLGKGVNQVTKAIKEETKAIREQVELQEAQNIIVQDQLGYLEELQKENGRYNRGQKAILDTEEFLLLSRDLLIKAGIKEAKMLTDSNIAQDERYSILVKLNEGLNNNVEIQKAEALLLEQMKGGKIEDANQTVANITRLKVQREEFLKYLETLDKGKEKESDFVKTKKKLSAELLQLQIDDAEKLLTLQKEANLKELNETEYTADEKNELRVLYESIYLEELKDLRESNLEDFKEFAEESVQESIDVIDDLYKQFLDKNKQAGKDAQKFISDYIRTQQNELRESREQERILNQAFSSTASVLNSLNDLRQEHHQAQLDRLARERDVVLANDTLTQTEKEKRINAIESKEIETQKKKIKLERDMFTIEQTLMIAKTIMNARFYAQQQLMMAGIQAQQAGDAVTSIGLEASKELGKASMSLGSFMSALGPAGVIAFGASIGVALASIKKARDAAKNQIANLVPGVSSVGGGSSPSVQAPAFNVVGATQESQLAQAISGQDDKPIKAFVVASDISTAQELERSTIEGASIG
jgi:hypothetical protein